MALTCLFHVQGKESRNDSWCCYVSQRLFPLPVDRFPSCFPFRKIRSYHILASLHDARPVNQEPAFGRVYMTVHRLCSFGGDEPRRDRLLFG